MELLRGRREEPGNERLGTRLPRTDLDRVPVRGTVVSRAPVYAAHAHTPKNMAGSRD